MDGGISKSLLFPFLDNPLELFVDMLEDFERVKFRDYGS
jgi:hypothetical protein